MTTRMTWLTAGLVMTACLSPVWADEEVAPKPSDATPPAAVESTTTDAAPQPAKDESKKEEKASTPAESYNPPAAPAPKADNAPSADDVIEQLLRQRQEPPLTQPQRQPAKTDLGSAPIAVEEKNALGTAPQNVNVTKASRTELRREGTFIISRRGRVVRSPGGARSLFVLDADDARSPELPLVLLPSQMTQGLEELSIRHGDRTVFVVTGQVFTYRGANYLLPTMVQRNIDKGNLQH